MTQRSDPPLRSARPSRCCTASFRTAGASHRPWASSGWKLALLSVAPSLAANAQLHPTFEFKGIACDRRVFQPHGRVSQPVSRGAYGMGNVVFDDSQGVAHPGDGSGQTIAIVDAYDDPNAASDLNAFSTYYGLPQFGGSGGPTFQKLERERRHDPAGTTDGLGNGGDWEMEESLDIEWAHVMAPMANIILFEATSDAATDLYTAVQTAASHAGRGCRLDELERQRVLRRDERRLDLHHAVGPSRRLGDDGRHGIGGRRDVSGRRRRQRGLCTPDSTTITPQYPACFAQRRRGGRDQLVPQRQQLRQRDRLGQRHQQRDRNGGGGGGISAYETQPSYQAGVVSSAYSTQPRPRTYPDVSADANPYTGVPIYDSYDYGSSTPWFSGTSAARVWPAPCGPA